MELERVQAISKMSKCMDTIPSDYIRSENEQPAVTTMQGVVLEVPVIDLGLPDEENLVRLIAEASREWGIFQVVNHGIPDDAVAKLRKVGKEFFELPQEEKELIAKPEGYQGVEGYGTKLQKEVGGKKGWVDHLFHIIWPKSAINYHFWPKNPPLYREANEKYAIALRGVVDKLYEALSLGIGLERQELKEASGGNDLIYMLKINYYPPCPRPDLALGVVPHTDMSAITILVPNEVQGLKSVKMTIGMMSTTFPMHSLSILVIKLTEIMSNGNYKSVYHRTTLNKDKTRMSWPVFLEPPPELLTGPISKLVTYENPAKFKTKKYKEYVYCKLNKLPQ